ncbi:molybdopterin molybdotransferase MoeA [Nibrella saemangeumensis]|uniref:Molybdopterin molybdenumtransferase n=1 Tax=Nibrella saemangeumensis TaxID=1084526 RepID=A0ABP8NSM1_9BACT
MLSVTEALSHILSHSHPLPAETVPLTRAVGRILREDIQADRDFPPFDRVTMDGIAIRYEAFASGQRTFPIAGTQFAGQPLFSLTSANECLEVMTGAVLPDGTDTVIRYEDLTTENGMATITIEEISVGQNVHRQATDRQAGEVLLTTGTRLRPTEIAVLASVGKPTVAVSARPRVALISTGDELVGVDEMPLPHQIRGSNTYMLQAALLTLGIETSLNHLPDDQEKMTRGLSSILAENDLLILSGGVSAGMADFVPAVMMALGVRERFHKIAQRPGKPLWFGTTDTGKVVFGLPGNPVSTTMCLFRYLLPFLNASMKGQPESTRYATLAEQVLFKPALTYFLPVRLTSQPDGSQLAYPLPGSGSGDYANLIDANGFMELPADQSEFAAGEVYPVLLFGEI